MKKFFFSMGLCLLAMVGMVCPSQAQRISSAELVKEVSPMYMGEGDTIFDYSCDLKLNASPTGHHLHLTLVADSISGHHEEMIFGLQELSEYELDTLDYLLPFGPLDISNYGSMRVEIVNSSDAIIEELEIDL